MPRHWVDEFWYCDFCGKPFRKEKDAIACGHNHSKAVEIQDAVWGEDSNFHEPVYLKVLTSDGKIVVYEHTFWKYEDVFPGNDEEDE